MKLTVDEIINKFGSPRAMYEALDVSKAALTNMKRRGFIPPAKAIEIHKMMDIDIDIGEIPVEAP